LLHYVELFLRDPGTVYLSLVERSTADWFTVADVKNKRRRIRKIIADLVAEVHGTPVLPDIHVGSDLDVPVVHEDPIKKRKVVVSESDEEVFHDVIGPASDEPLVSTSAVVDNGHDEQPVPYRSLFSSNTVAPHPPLSTGDGSSTQSPPKHPFEESDHVSTGSSGTVIEDDIVGGSGQEELEMIVVDDH
jgi:hypothetical protein